MNIRYSLRAVKILAFIFVTTLTLSGCAFLALAPDSPALQTAPASPEITTLQTTTPPAEATPTPFPSIVIIPTEAATVPVLPTCPPTPTYAGTPPTKTPTPTVSIPTYAPDTPTVTGTPPTPEPLVTPTPLPIFRTIDLSPNVADEHKIVYLIQRSAGFYEVVIVDARLGQIGVDYRSAIQLCPGDRIIQSLSLVPLPPTYIVEPRVVWPTYTPSPGAP